MGGYKCTGANVQISQYSDVAHKPKGVRSLTINFPVQSKWYIFNKLKIKRIMKQKHVTADAGWPQKGHLGFVGNLTRGDKSCVCVVCRCNAPPGTQTTTQQSKMTVFLKSCPIKNAQLFVIHHFNMNASKVVVCVNVKKTRMRFKFTTSYMLITISCWPLLINIP